MANTKSTVATLELTMTADNFASNGLVETVICREPPANELKSFTVTG